MKKIAMLPLVVALAASAACTRSNDTAVKSAGIASAQTVELTGNGLTTGSRGLHHPSLVEFGQPRAKVIADISAVLGRPTATGRNAECPSGPVDFASFGPLDLHFEGGRFTGWVIDEAGGPEIQSYHGLSFGDRRSELDGDVEIEQVEDGTLGTELRINGIGVIMSGPGEADRVTNLFAGTTCFAR